MHLFLWVDGACAGGSQSVVTRVALASPGNGGKISPIQDLLTQKLWGVYLQSDFSQALQGALVLFKMGETLVY